MLTEIFQWLEQYSGVIYGFEDTLDQISGDYAFGEPFMWKCGLELSFETLAEITDLIDKYAAYIPDDLPGAIEMKKMVTDDTMEKIIKNINHVKKNLLIDSVSFKKYTELQMHVNALYELILLVLNNSIETIMEKNLFERLNEDLDGILVDRFEIGRNDIAQIHFNANDIRDNYYAKMEEA